MRDRLLRSSALPLVVGHSDWESQNVRWVDRQLYVVHDWDSVVAQREATIAGAASAVFTVTDAPNSSASVAQSAAFLAAYEQARERQWSDKERELAWAAACGFGCSTRRKEHSDRIVKTLRPHGSASRLRPQNACAEPAPDGAQPVRETDAWLHSLSLAILGRESRRLPRSSHVGDWPPLTPTTTQRCRTGKTMLETGYYGTKAQVRRTNNGSEHTIGFGIEHGSRSWRPNSRGPYSSAASR